MKPFYKVFTSTEGRQIFENNCKCRKQKKFENPWRTGICLPARIGRYYQNKIKISFYQRPGKKLE